MTLPSLLTPRIFPRHQLCIIFDLLPNLCLNRVEALERLVLLGCNRIYNLREKRSDLVQLRMLKSRHQQCQHQSTGVAPNRVTNKKTFLFLIVTLNNPCRTLKNIEV